MPYAQLHIQDGNGDWVPWNGELTDRDDGTLGTVHIATIREEKVLDYSEGVVTIMGNQHGVIATFDVAVGQALKVFGYAMSASSANIDLYEVHVGPDTKRTIFSGTYAGGLIRDHLLIDNRQGAAPVTVELHAANGSPLNTILASGNLLVEDVTDVMA